jgi:hypothetical protein
VPAIAATASGIAPVSFEPEAAEAGGGTGVGGCPRGCARRGAAVHVDAAGLNPRADEVAGRRVQVNICAW